MSNKFYTLLFLFVPLFLNAQTTTGGWIEFYPDMYTKNGKWKITPEVNYRINNFKGSQSFILRPHVTYYINKYISAEVGAWYTMTWDDFTANKDEIGIYQQMDFKTPTWHRFSLGLRIRQDEIFSKSRNADNFDFGARIRIRPNIKYSLPVWEKKKLYVLALVETLDFWNNREHFSDAFWIAGRFGISPTARLSAIFEYNYGYTYNKTGTDYSQRVRLLLRYKIF